MHSCFRLSGGDRTLYLSQPLCEGQGQWRAAYTNGKIHTRERFLQMRSHSIRVDVESCRRHEWNNSLARKMKGVHHDQVNTVTLTDWRGRHCYMSQVSKGSGSFTLTRLENPFFDVSLLRIRFLESANSVAGFGLIVDLEPSPSHFPEDRWVLKIEWLWSLTETEWLWRLIILIQTFPWCFPPQPFCSVCKRDVW